MGFDDMEKADKVKLFVAVGVLVIAAGAIGWYFFGSGGQSTASDTPAAAPAPDTATKGGPKPASNRRSVPGAN